MKDYSQAIYDNWSGSASTGNKASYIESTSRKLTMHNRDFEDLLKDRNNKRENYPMFAKISFNTHPGEAFVSEIIHDYNYENAFFSVFEDAGIYHGSNEQFQRHITIKIDQGVDPASLGSWAVSNPFYYLKFRFCN